jgi:2-dehydro-3-deoxygluconokinase
VASVLTLGETMALLDPLQDGPIDEWSCFRLRVAGAESNFAIALSRLGVSVEWISQVGDDAFGDLVVRAVSSEGVGVDHVKVHPTAPTGMYFKVRDAGSSRVFYYRKDSAASHMAPGDVPDQLWDGVRLVHLTGITMGISSSARDLVVETAARAKRGGAMVSFDPNYRPSLWSGSEDAAAACREVFSYTDWYLCGLDEGMSLFGVGDASELFTALREAGIKRAVVRIGPRGAIIDEGSGPVEVPPAELERVVDEIGAGDGFAAGFTFALLHGWDARTGVAVGNWMAGRALRGTGDWETYPTRRELEEFLGDQDEGPPSP